MGFSQPTQPSSMRPWPPLRRPCPNRLALLQLALRSFDRNAVRASVPVPEAQRKALTVSPGSESVLFNEEILGVVVAQVQQSSLISSNLAVSRSLGRSRARSSSSSPLVDPSAPGSSRTGRPHGKRSSSSSSRSGGRKRFRGSKGSAPSSKPVGFRK